MNTIHKFPIELIDEQRIIMPAGAKPIHVGLDPKGQLCLWAEVEDTEPPTGTRIFIVGTGTQIPRAAAHHIGSVVLPPFVWHIYTQ